MSDTDEPSTFPSEPRCLVASSSSRTTQTRGFGVVVPSVVQRGSDVDALATDMTALFNDARTSDVRLIVGLQSEPKTVFYAHKALLASRCAYFRAMFFGELQTLEATSGEVELLDTPAPIFAEVLKYLYTGAWDFTGGRSVAIMHLADRYGLDTLKTRCSAYNQHIIDDDSVCDLLQTAQLYNDGALTEKCRQYIRQHTPQVLATAAFAELPIDLAADIIKDDLLTASEMEIFQSSVQWARHQAARQSANANAADAATNAGAGGNTIAGGSRSSSRSSCGTNAASVSEVFDKIVHLIRFPFISPLDLQNNVQTTGLVSEALLREAYQYHAVGATDCNVTSPRLQPRALVARATALHLPPAFAPQYAAIFNRYTNEYWLKDAWTNSKIQRFDGQGVHTGSFDIGDYKAICLGTDASGALYCADNKKSFYKFDRCLNLIWEQTITDATNSNNNQARGITSDEQFVYALFNRGSIWKIHRDTGRTLSHITPIPSFQNAFGMVVVDNRFIISDRNGAEIYTLDGQYERTLVVGCNPVVVWTGKEIQVHEIQWFRFSGKFPFPQIHG